MMPACWNLSPAHAEVGDETPLPILDREDGTGGRTICLLPELLSTLADLTEWAARIGCWDASCWRDAEDLLRRIRSASPPG